MGTIAELRDPAGVVLAVGAAVASSLSGLPAVASMAVGAAALAARSATAIWLERRASAPPPPTAYPGPTAEAAPAPTTDAAPAPTTDAAPTPSATARTPAAPPERGDAPLNVFRPEGEYWTIGYRGSTFRLRDAKGLRHLHRLLADPGREFHVTDLVTVTGETRADHGVPAREGLSVVSSSDAGSLLDPEAKAAYRRRLEDLREEADEARSWGDRERAARAEEEIAALADELARAVGLHGADRKAVATAERARVNVTRAVKSAIERIAEHDRALAHHLSSTVRTGTFCAYVPAPDDPPTWQL